MMFALIMGAVAAYAQQGSGDYYEGLSRKIGFSQMIPPHGLEITYDKTVHIIFPIFGDVVVRVSPSFTLAMHIDTDEANGANVPRSGCQGHIVNVEF